MPETGQRIGHVDGLLMLTLLLLLASDVVWVPKGSLMTTTVAARVLLLVSVVVVVVVVAWLFVCASWATQRSRKLVAVRRVGRVVLPGGPMWRLPVGVYGCCCCGRLAAKLRC